MALESAQEADALLAQSVPARLPGGVANRQSLEKREAALHRLRLDDHKLDTGLKKTIGKVAIFVMAAQFFCTNVGFGVYLYWMQWVHLTPVPSAVMIGWFSATLVEIIGLVLVVAKYIFPSSGNNWNHETTN